MVEQKQEGNAQAVCKVMKEVKGNYVWFDFISQGEEEGGGEGGREKTRGGEGGK